MASKEFKTNGWLWFWISLVLFVVPWFIPMIDCKGDHLPPAWFFIIPFISLDHMEGAIDALGCIVICSLLFSVPAISIGRVFQCMIVLAKSRKEQNTPDKTPDI
jgi:hypothetical protein